MAQAARSLYEQCLGCYVRNLNYKVLTLNSLQALQFLPPGVLIDIYVRMAQRDELKDMLYDQLSDLKVFERLLRFDPARQKLFRCLSVLMGCNRPLAAQLQRNFTMCYQRGNSPLRPVYKLTAMSRAKLAAALASAASAPPESAAAAIAAIYSANVASTSTAAATAAAATDYVAAGCSCSANANDTVIDNQADRAVAEVIAQADALAVSDAYERNRCTTEVIDFGLRLGSFLSEAGWLSESTEVLLCIAAQLRSVSSNDEKLTVVRLDCLQRLLHSEAALCNFKSAERTFDEIVDLLTVTPTEHLPHSLLANVYTQFSAMFFARSEYDDSHMWSTVAMQYLEEITPERIAIDVLRQAAKSCVVKRDFQRANVLICQATRRARRVFGSKHQKYGDTLLDYGFFLLNVDSVYQSVNVYKEALEIKRSLFGNRNFHVAIAHEDLSYAYYVHEYSTGNFTCAREHVEKAVDIMKDLVPSDHLMLASAKRVKALLLEEIALDKMAEGVHEEGLLKQSEELHKFALNLSLDVFGEVNVQTAKHYGNLGRLYQTMNRFEEAERMHQKAIKIKTDLLGPYDYEVGLSIGHLASLYNYQMKKYREAEDLYLRSIEISLRLFGRSYSGLEYDYLGLCHVYETLREFEKYLKYASILENWQMLRGQNITMNKSIYPAIVEDCSLEDVKYQFFNMCNLNFTACN